MACVANFQGYFEVVNPQFLNVLGYSKQEVLENSLFDIVHSDDMQATLMKTEKLKKGDRVIQFENRFLRKDGTSVWLAWNAIPDTSTGKWYAIGRDISERKKAEKQFQLVVESALNAIILVNEHGKIVLINKRTETLFGYERDELIGNKMELLLPDRFRKVHPTLRNKFAANPQTRAMGAGRELFAKRKDGSEVPVEIGLNPMEGENLILVSIIIYAITNLKIIVVIYNYIIS